jgi:hypothetical protein
MVGFHPIDAGDALGWAGIQTKANHLLVCVVSNFSSAKWGIFFTGDSTERTFRANTNEPLDEPGSKRSVGR